MNATPEKDFPGIGQVFNLVSESAIDGARVVAERLQRAADAAAAREYQMRMQRTFKECPGFVGGDFPDGECRRGHVDIDPAKAADAVAWLKKRVTVNEALGLSGADLLTIEFLTRRRGRAVPGQKRPAVSFKKPEQFALPL